MSQALTMARNRLLLDSGLDDNSLNKALSILSRHGGIGDLYFQSARGEAWMLEDGSLKEAAIHLSQGLGARAMRGEKTGFAYSDDIVLPALLEASEMASRIAHSSGGHRVLPLRVNAPRPLYQPLNPSASLDNKAKVALLSEADKIARAADPRIRQVNVSLSGSCEAVLIAGSDGTLAADVRPLVCLRISVIAEHKRRREQGYAGAGGRWDYRRFIRERQVEKLAKEAARQACVNLEAVPAPAGEQVVVLGPGWPGILLHEAVGHGLEGDFAYQKTSAFSGRIGERVASPNVTVVDDGTLPGRRGSLSVDDEGTPGACTTLIENGELRQFMQDKRTARLMGATATGNGRRQSYAHLPMPRMTNTYMLAGEHHPQDIIASVDRGVYAVHFGGGQVDITSGKFVFSASEAYAIERGKITRPLKGASLIGHGPDVLTRVSMVGNDLSLDDGIGTCGKQGQTVPVGVGQPTLRIERLTVGGTQM